jgi:hypothetical protein
MRYVILIEEAHNIVGCAEEAQPSPDIANPKAFAAEYVCRMLAEVRSLGVGIIIVDQLPSAVAPEVIKNTATKWVFKVLEREDRELIGDSMLLKPVEIQELARLKVGDAFIHTEDYHDARRIKTVDLHSQFNFRDVDADKDILPYLRDDAWFQKAAIERTTSELFEFKERADRFDAERLQLSQELCSLLPLQLKLLAEPLSKDRSAQLSELSNEASKLKRRLSDKYCSFSRNSYRRYLMPETGGQVLNALPQEMKDNLVNRFESIIKPDVDKCSETIDTFIIRCQEAQK